MHYRFFNLTLVLTILSALTLPELTQAQSLTCSLVEGSHTTQRPTKPTPTNLADLPINLLAGGAEVSQDGWNSLTGKVEISQGDRTISTDALRFNALTGEMVASGSFSLEDSTLFLSGRDARLSRIGGAQVNQAGFLLKSNGGRGVSQSIQLAPNGNLSLTDVNYTTCPAGEPSWELKLSELDINQASRTGTGRNVRLEFKGVPIFYTPWISFPVGNERKSGFLFPSIGGSSRSGNAISIPWYWDIAPNYDDTITPSFITNRGVKLDNEFRYLGDSRRATLVTGYLPYDNDLNRWRGTASLRYIHDLNDSMRVDVTANSVSDHAWFEDFGTSSAITSQVYLQSSITLSAQSAHWHGELQLLNLQTLDNDIALGDRPFTQLPRLTLNGSEPLPWGMNFKLDSELTYFTRGIVDAVTQTKSITGTRLHLNPLVSLPLNKPGMFLTPSFGWHYTGYQLNHTADNMPANPSLSGTIYSLDTGLIFERSSSQSRRLQTLEPRLLYVYVPYHDQRTLPTAIDTGIPDLNLVQLFRANRFIGPDRLGDTNQLSAGFTSRLLNTGDGSQYLSGTLGQSFYFSTPCVTSLSQTHCDSSSATTHASDLIGELSVTTYRHFNFNLGTQWTPKNNQTQRSNVFIQYHPDNTHIVNLGYRYDHNTVEQWESSMVWPIGQQWSGYGRVVYSQLDNTFLDHFAGFEYRSCCFNVRGVVGRAITTRSGQYDTQYKLQLELKGLSSIGTADAFLTGGIAGYSTGNSPL